MMIRNSNQKGIINSNKITMKAIGWTIIILIALVLMFSGWYFFYADNKAYPESDTTMYFNIVFEGDTVIHK